MQELSTVKNESSEQHKDVSKTRQEQDLKDTRDILKFLVDRDPVGNDKSLHSISTGVFASENVNAYIAKAIGEKMLQSME